MSEDRRRNTVELIAHAETLLFRTTTAHINDRVHRAISASADVLKKLYVLRLEKAPKNPPR